MPSEAINRAIDCIQAIDVNFVALDFDVSVYVPTSHTAFLLNSSIVPNTLIFLHNINFTNSSLNRFVCIAYSHS